MPRLLNILGYLYLELGDIETALAYDHRALNACRWEGLVINRETERYSLLNLANDHLQAGQIETATAYLQEFEAILDQTEYSRLRYFNRYLLVQAELNLIQGNYELALDFTAEAMEMAKAKNIRKNITKCLLFEGQVLLGLERSTESVERLKQAVALADEIAHASLRWKTRLRLAEAYAMLGQPNADLYEQALAQVETLAKNLRDTGLRQAFLASPLILELKANARSPIKRPTPPPTEYPAGLTPREVEVLGLVAQGLTNRQIAERLTISVRTINTHMTNILNKTNCDNRTAATAFAVQHNLV